MHKIVLAPVWKRFLAAILDAVVFLLLLLGVFAAVQAIFNVTPYINSLKNDITYYSLKSGLYYEKEGNLYPYTEEQERIDYQFYFDMIEDFYIEDDKLLSFPDQNVVVLNETYTQFTYEESKYYWFNVNILGLDDDLNLYPNRVLKKPSQDGKKYFTYAKDSEGNLLYGSEAVPLDEFLLSSGNVSAFGNEQLRSFLYKTDDISLYYLALETFTNLPNIQYLSGEYSVMLQAYPLSIALAISFPIYYVVIPLFLRDRATLIKRFFGLGLMTKYGFKATRAQTLLRGLPVYCIMMIVFIFLNQNIATIILLGLLLISYFVSLFTTQHTALHDLVAGTVVIDSKNSLIYSSREEQDSAEKELGLILDRATESVNKGKKMVEEEKQEKL